MNGGVTLAVVGGTTLGLAVVLYATYAGMSDAVIAAGGVVVLCSVGVMTAAIAAVDGDGHADHG